MFRLIYLDADQQQSYSFSNGELVLGRSPECQVVLKDFGISRQHARIVVDDDGVRIQDLKSKNGTSVNGTTVMEAVLHDGDRILLGKFQLTFGRSKSRDVRAAAGEARRRVEVDRRQRDRRRALPERRRRRKPKRDSQ